MNIIYIGILFILAFILLQIPILGKYLSVINTLVHEIGHALTAIFTGGRVQKIELFSNTEGTAWTQSKHWLGRFLTSFSGYPFASFTSFFFMYLILLDTKFHYQVQRFNISFSITNLDIILYVLIVFLFISLIFWIRNWYGFFWAASLIIINVLLIRFDLQLFQEIFVVFITCILVIR